MFHLDYELLDVGGGRRLERFGPWILDRLSPAAEAMTPLFPEKWTQADAVFVAENHSTTNSSQNSLHRRGYWKYNPALTLGATRWVCSAAKSMQFEITCTPFGHVGVFPEQQENWNRIGRYCQKFYDKTGTLCRVLNLFSYTGGSTLAAASQGASVVHVDSSRSAVEWARRNAAISQLDTTPIRWIVDDAAKFVQRERKRQQTYDLVILDPPSYGHGRGATVWQLQRDIFPLLCNCAMLVADSPQGAILVSCHTTGYTAEHLREHLLEAVKMSFSSSSISTRYPQKAAVSADMIETFEMTIPITTTPHHFSAGVAAFFLHSIHSHSTW